MAAPTPEADPARSPDPVERTRASIGVRVERLLATAAFRAAAQGERELRIADEQRFLPWMSKELLELLPINRQEATPLLDGLLAELRQFARDQGLTASWGKLTARPDGLVLELKPFERGTTPRRARAEVLHRHEESGVAVPAVQTQMQGSAAEEALKRSSCTSDITVFQPQAQDSLVEGGRWGSIAIAARIARRIQFLFPLARPAASAADLAALDRAIAYAEQTVRQRKPQPSGFTFQDVQAPLGLVTSLGRSVDEIFSARRHEVLEAITPPATRTAVCAALVAHTVASVAQVAEWNEAAFAGLDALVKESKMALDAAVEAGLLSNAQKQALSTLLQPDFRGLHPDTPT
jgi:hypothetical protein